MGKTLTSNGLTDCKRHDFALSAFTHATEEPDLSGVTSFLVNHNFYKILYLSGNLKCFQQETFMNEMSTVYLHPSTIVCLLQPFITSHHAEITICGNTF